MAETAGVYVVEVCGAQPLSLEYGGALRLKAQIGFAQGVYLFRGPGVLGDGQGAESGHLAAQLGIYGLQARQARVYALGAPHLLGEVFLMTPRYGLARF